MEDNLVYYHLF